MNIAAALILGSIVTAVAIWNVVSVIRKEKASSEGRNLREDQIKYTAKLRNAFAHGQPGLIQELIDSELNLTGRLQDVRESADAVEMEKVRGFQHSVITHPANVINITFMHEEAKRLREAALTREAQIVEPPLNDSVGDARRSVSAAETVG